MTPELIIIAAVLILAGVVGYVVYRRSVSRAGPPPIAGVMEASGPTRYWATDYWPEVYWPNYGTGTPPAAANQGDTILIWLVVRNRRR